MFRLTIALAVVSGCSSTFDITRPVSNAPDLVTWLRGPRDCFTPCGMRALEGDCESLQRYEGRIVRELAKAVPEWSSEKICDGLKGYELHVRRRDALLDKSCSSQGWDSIGCRGCVIGCTEPVPHTITVHTDDWQHSALAHEIAHVADEVRPGHCPWKSAELKATLYDLAGFVDPSGPEAVCSP